MKSFEFWSKLPLSEKLYMARLVVESADVISPSASDKHALEKRAELRDLAAKMLEVCVTELRDPTAY